VCIHRLRFASLSYFLAPQGSTPCRRGDWFMFFALRKTRQWQGTVCWHGVVFRPRTQIYFLSGCESQLLPAGKAAPPDACRWRSAAVPIDCESRLVRLISSSCWRRISLACTKVPPVLDQLLFSPHCNVAWPFLAPPIFAIRSWSQKERHHRVPHDTPILWITTFSFRVSYVKVAR